MNPVLFLHTNSSMNVKGVKTMKEAFVPPIFLNEKPQQPRRENKNEEGNTFKVDTKRSNK